MLNAERRSNFLLSSILKCRKTIRWQYLCPFGRSIVPLLTHGMAVDILEEADVQGWMRGGWRV